MLRISKTLPVAAGNAVRGVFRGTDRNSFRVATLGGSEGVVAISI
jgi:hypothetical protein